METWINLIIAILSGLATAIPLVIQLIKYIKQAIKSKNWSALMTLVLQLMTEAEKDYSTGTERKKYVIDTIKAMEGTLNYDIDENVISDMIDAIVTASKTINSEKKNEE